MKMPEMFRLMVFVALLNRELVAVEMGGINVEFTVYPLIKFWDLIFPVHLE